jgi:hypothetical protein
MAWPTSDSKNIRLPATQVASENDLASILTRIADEPVPERLLRLARRLDQEISELEQRHTPH